MPRSTGVRMWGICSFPGERRSHSIDSCIYRSSFPAGSGSGVPLPFLLRVFPSHCAPGRTPHPTASARLRWSPRGTCRWKGPSARKPTSSCSIPIPFFFSHGYSLYARSLLLSPVSSVLLPGRTDGLSSSPVRSIPPSRSRAVLWICLAVLPDPDRGPASSFSAPSWTGVHDNRPFFFD